MCHTQTHTIHFAKHIIFLYSSSSFFGVLCCCCNRCCCMFLLVIGIVNNPKLDELLNVSQRIGLRIWSHNVDGCMCARLMVCVWVSLCVCVCRMSADSHWVWFDAVVVVRTEWLYSNKDRESSQDLGSLCLVFSVLSFRTVVCYEARRFSPFFLSTQKKRKQNPASSYLHYDLTQVL